MKMRFVGLLVFLLLVLQSCSIRRFAVRHSTPVLRDAVTAFYEEDDLNVARPALAANLKLIEGLLKSDPQNDDLRLLLAQGWAGYALAFAEDTNQAEARNLYLRAKKYAQSVLQHRLKLDDNWQATSQSVAQAMQKARRSDVPALFWTGFAWAGAINLSLGNPGALADLPKVDRIMYRVRQLDSTYFYGGVFLYFASIYGQKPRILGGNPQKARKLFETNFKITQGKFLLSYVYAAKFYAAKILDEDLFRQYLNRVLQTPLSVAPQIKLLNKVAKQKARKLLAREKDIF